MLLLQPIKCHECGNLLQSYELLKAHQSLPNHCGTCKDPFKTTCDLLRHKCEGPEESGGKKIRIKTEPVGKYSSEYWRKDEKATIVLPGKRLSFKVQINHFFGQRSDLFGL